MTDWHRPKQQLSAVKHSVYRFILPVFVGVLLVAYLGITNNVATQGYHMQTLQHEIEELEKQNAGIEFAIAAEQSLQRVESSLPSLALSPVANIEYLEAASSSVAIR